MGIIGNGCDCKLLDRNEGEEMRDWLKRCMCMFHWKQTDYYKDKVRIQKGELG